MSTFKFSQAVFFSLTYIWSYNVCFIYEICYVEICKGTSKLRLQKQEAFRTWWSYFEVEKYIKNISVNGNRWIEIFRFVSIQWSMKTELCAKEVGEFSVMLHGKMGWWASFAHHHGCRNTTVQTEILKTLSSYSPFIHCYMKLAEILQMALFTSCKSFVSKIVNFNFFMTSLQTKNWTARLLIQPFCHFQPTTLYYLSCADNKKHIQYDFKPLAYFWNPPPPPPPEKSIT